MTIALDTDTYTVSITDGNKVQYTAPGSRRSEEMELREINGTTAVLARPMLAAPAEVLEVSVFRLAGSF